MELDNKCKRRRLVLASSVLSNHLIFNEICKYLPFPDLLVLSTLSREHKESTRAYMLKHRICCVRPSQTSIPASKNPCQLLKLFDEFLSKSSSNACAPFPCNGYRDLFLAWSLCTPQIQKESHNIDQASLAETFPNILEKLELKYFMLAWTFNFCPVYIRVMKELFLRNAHRLERVEISLGDQPRTFSTLRLCTSDLDNRKQFAKMPNLRTLHFEMSNSQSNEIELSLMEFLEAAPNLQTLSGELTSHTLTLPEASLRGWSKTLFRNIHFDFENLSLPNVQCISRTELQLSDMDLTAFQGQSEVMYKDEILLKSWEPLMLSILRNSQRTLRKLFCTMSQLLYVSEQIDSFPNLENLRVQSGTDKGTYARMLEYLGVIDLERVFPNLPAFNLYPYDLPGFNNHPLDAILLREQVCNPNTFPVPTVNKVWMHNNCHIYEPEALADITETAFVKIVETFPNVKDLFISRALLERHFNSAPGGKLKWKIQTLNLRYYTVSEEAMQNLFPGLQNGLQALHLEPLPRILDECGNLFKMVEDGYVIPFMPNELAQKVQEDHPGLEIIIDCSYYEFQKPGISLTSFCSMKPFATARITTFNICTSTTSTKRDILISFHKML